MRIVSAGKGARGAHSKTNVLLCRRSQIQPEAIHTLAECYLIALTQSVAKGPCHRCRSALSHRLGSTTSRASQVCRSHPGLKCWVTQAPSGLQHKPFPAACSDRYDPSVIDKCSLSLSLGAAHVDGSVLGGRGALLGRG